MYLVLPQFSSSQPTQMRLQNKKLLFTRSNWYRVNKQRHMTAIRYNDTGLTEACQQRQMLSNKYTDHNCRNVNYYWEKCTQFTRLPYLCPWVSPYCRCLDHVTRRCIPLFLLDALHSVVKCSEKLDSLNGTEFFDRLPNLISFARLYMITNQE